MPLQSSPSERPSGAESEVPEGGMVAKIGGAAIELTEFEDTVLVLASLGGRLEEVAGLVAGGDTEKIEETRDVIIEKFGVQNMAAAVNQAIVRGKLEIQPAKTSTPNVTDEQRRILQLIAKGNSNSDIIDELQTTTRHKHFGKDAMLNIMRSLYKRIDANGRTHSVRRSYELGIAQLED